MTPWTPVAEQSETWTETAVSVRVFDPHVFERAPTFDTGFTSGIWDDSSTQTETWTQA
jgi:hypothetical protein